MSGESLRLFLVRHGETPWSLSGQHTGRTDVALTENGQKQAKELAGVLKREAFSAAFTSPLSRARQTAALAGFADATVCDDLSELDYGKYEGLTLAEIRNSVPNWTVWTHSCPAGETLQHAAERAQRMIDAAAAKGGDVVMFSHGHCLRILAATWLQCAPSAGKNLVLGAGSVSILFHEHEAPAIKLWNWSTNCLA